MPSKSPKKGTASEVGAAAAASSSSPSPSASPKANKGQKNDVAGTTGASASAGMGSSTPAAAAPAPPQSSSGGGLLPLLKLFYRVTYSIVVFLFLGYLAYALYHGVGHTSYERCYGTAWPEWEARSRLLQKGDFQGYGQGNGKCERREYWDAEVMLGQMSIRAFSHTYTGNWFNGQPNGKGQYVGFSAWFEYVRPPYHYNGPDRVRYDGQFVNNKRDGLGLLELSGVGMKYFGNFENNSFVSPTSTDREAAKSGILQQIDMSHPEQADPNKPFDFLHRGVRYRGAVAAGGVFQGRGTIYFRGKAFSSQTQWTRLSGQFDRGLLVKPDGFITVVTGRDKRSFLEKNVTIHKWENALSALTGHRSLTASVGDCTWDAASSKLTCSSGKEVEGHGESADHALKEALQALHKFEDHTRHDNMVSFVEKLEFPELWGDTQAELEATGEFAEFSPKAVQKIYEDRKAKANSKSK